MTIWQYRSRRLGPGVRRLQRERPVDALPHAHRRGDPDVALAGEGARLPGVVTELAPAGDFWEAEPEHQDYLERYPNGYTCHFLRPNWKLPRRSAAA